LGLKNFFVSDRIPVIQENLFDSGRKFRLDFLYFLPSLTHYANTIDMYERKLQTNLLVLVQIFVNVDCNLDSSMTSWRREIIWPGLEITAKKRNFCGFDTKFSPFYPFRLHGRQSPAYTTNCTHKAYKSCRDFDYFPARPKFRLIQIPARTDLLYLVSSK